MSDDEAEKNSHIIQSSVERRDVLKGLGMAGAVAAIPSVARASGKNESNGFDPIEATVADVISAITTHQETAQSITELYLDRIEEYDDELAAFITVNTDAISRAQELDSKFEEQGLIGPLHGVPVVLKNNYDTGDLPTTAGNVLFEDTIPPNDAFLVKQLRDAGGVVLGKANLQELAFGSEGISSLGGQTKNPYDTDRIPGGSSSGTGAGIAANLGVIGTGSDTGGSVRSPAVYCNLVGIRPTIGLLSRDGIVPYSETQDTGGPMTRTVADTAVALDVMAGYDEADPVTSRSLGKTPAANGESYTDYLNPDSLSGARVGLMTEYLTPADPEVIDLVETAIEDIEQLGATVVEIEDGLRPVPDAAVSNLEVNRDFNAYLDELGDVAPVDTLEELVESETVVEAFNTRENVAEAAEVNISELDQNVEYLRALSLRSDVQELLLAEMSERELDALLYPERGFPPSPVGTEALTVEGDLARSLAPLTGFPAISLPAGFTASDELPIGIEFLGPPFSEPSLIELSYAYEQATMHRRAPEAFGKIN